MLSANDHTVFLFTGACTLPCLASHKRAKSLTSQQAVAKREMEYIEKEDESERKKVVKPPAKKSSAPPSTPRSVLLAKTRGATKPCRAVLPEARGRMQARARNAPSPCSLDVCTVAIDAKQDRYVYLCKHHAEAAAVGFQN